MMQELVVAKCHLYPERGIDSVIGEKERYHGVAFARLIQDAGTALTIEAQSDRSRCAYVLNGDIALFIKHSTNRLSPWPFVFSPEQRKDLAKLSKQFQDLWIVLVCGHEGIALASWIEVTAKLIRSAESEGFSLQVSRQRAQKFRISGARQKPILVSDSSYPTRILAG